MAGGRSADSRVAGDRAIRSGVHAASALDHALGAPDAPREIAERVEAVGVTKARLPLLTVVMLGVLAGGFIGLGALYFTVVVSDPTVGFAAGRVLGGVAFSLGLFLVVVAGDPQHDQAATVGQTPLPANGQRLGKLRQPGSDRRVARHAPVAAR
jgi:hypothetical protein